MLLLLLLLQIRCGSATTDGGNATVSGNRLRFSSNLPHPLILINALVCVERKDRQLKFTQKSQICIRFRESAAPREAPASAAALANLK